jgi:diacylglycerol kinase
METETKKEKKRFSVVARIKSTTHAWRGFGILLKTTHNLWVYIFFGILAIYLGVILNISSVEWLFIILVIGLVVIAEAFNTAIEIDINLTSPDYHPFARDTKDVAAAAVLLSIVTAGAVGIIVFLPKILVLF